MNPEKAQVFYLVSHIFGLGAEELDALLKQANLTWETAALQQISGLIKQYIGDEQYFLCLRWSNITLWNIF